MQTPCGDFRFGFPIDVPITIFSRSSLVAVLLISVVSSLPITWLPAGSSTCETACTRASLYPVSSGIYSLHDKDYWVCAANPGGNGYRAGYNLPSHSSGCIVGYDGRETARQAKRCLCKQDPDNSVLIWAEALEGKSCNVTCEAEGFGFEPIPSGLYGKRPFYVCSTNYGNHGDRPGYQIPDFEGNQCVVGYDYEEKASGSHGKKCLCYQSNKILNGGS